MDLSVPGGGHTSALLALAMLRDHDSDDDVLSGRNDPRQTSKVLSMSHPSSRQAKADPNILPPKQKPTTRSLAVAVGNQDLVEMLLEEAAEVHPQVDTVLMMSL